MAEEILNQGQQENAENLNENVSGQAKEIISAALEETQNRETSPVLKADSNVTDKFKGLPMRGTYCCSTDCSSRSPTGAGSNGMEFLPANCI